MSALVSTWITETIDGRSIVTLFNMAIWDHIDRFESYSTIRCSSTSCSCRRSTTTMAVSSLRYLSSSGRFSCTTGGNSARNTVSIRVAKRLSLRVSQAVQAADRLSRTRRELQGRPRASSSVHQLREQQQHVLLPLHEVPVTEGEIRRVQAGHAQPRLSADPKVLRELLIKNKEPVVDVIAPTISINKLPMWCAWPCTPEVLEADQCFEMLTQQILAPINPHTGVSMNRPAKLNGYEILCRMHVVLGHPESRRCSTRSASLRRRRA